MSVCGQAGSKSKDATLWVPVHKHPRTHAHTRLARLLFEAKKTTVLCAPCPYGRYSRYGDQALSVLYVCRLGTGNYDTVS